MSIKKLIIKNYKSFKYFPIEFNEEVNIIVGNNEAGKSTILEALNLVLTGQLNGKNILYEITPFIFNEDIVNDFINELKQDKKVSPPEILIELYLNDIDDYAELLGTNNSLKENAPGVFIQIKFNDEYVEEYKNYIKDPKEIKTIPVEYYEVKWYSFSHNSITARSIPINVSLVDTSVSRNLIGTDRYISKILEDLLETKERADLALNYRKLKETFTEQEAIKSINNKLTSKKGEISEKELTISVDISQKNNWESTLVPYLDNIPFQFIGKGEQNTVKLKLALEIEAEKSNLILIEEPENHLSYSKMNNLINSISKKCTGKQVIITTHSNFILNKLGMEKVILLENQKTVSLKDLEKETEDYFKKLPGYDTLRFLLSKKPILVEGPSDELIVQKAYLQKYGKLPIEDERDVITVRGLSFKRFLDIAKLLKKETYVVTDNDGDIEQLKNKYSEYVKNNYITICYDNDTTCKTLEPQIAKNNSLAILNKILDKKYTDKTKLIDYMINNKTEAALKIFESEEHIEIPKYIGDAIEK